MGGFLDHVLKPALGGFLLIGPLVEPRRCFVKILLFFGVGVPESTLEIEVLK